MHKSEKMLSEFEGCLICFKPVNLDMHLKNLSIVWWSSTKNRTFQTTMSINLILWGNKEKYLDHYLNDSEEN